jgi:hypothetical protein
VTCDEVSTVAGWMMSLPEHNPKRERELALQRQRQAGHVERLARHVRIAPVEFGEREIDLLVAADRLLESRRRQ